jgi:heavy metal translocating P-type ATPase
LYAGFFSELSTDSIRKLSWPIFVMASIVLGYGGRTIFKRALAGITTASASMETLIAVGASSAFVFSCYNFLQGSIHLYFDTAAMLITLVLLGKLLERGAKDKIQVSLETLFSLQPTKVKVSTPPAPDGRYMAAAYLAAGDVFLLDPGEIAPADGIVIDGDGLVDASSLTGEAIAVRHKPGDMIRSGIRVLEGHFKIRAQAVGPDSTLGQMIRIMEQALRQKTALEGKTDRMLRYFVPLILILAVLTGVAGVLWGLTFEQALIRAVTVTVIACPCALGVAIPLTRVAAIAVASRIGLLIRDYEAVESAGGVDTFVFDKTGTITRGRWVLQDIQTFGSVTQEQALAWALGLEGDTEHTIALEMKRYAAAAGVPPADVTHVKDHGNGRSGKWGRDTVFVGAKALVAALTDATGRWPTIDESDVANNASRVYLGYQDRLAAVFIFGDRLRSGAAGTVATLRSAGHQLVLLSGDGTSATQKVAQALGIAEFYGEQLPQDKANIIDRLQRQGRRVAMVGDGVNDAPALTRSDLAVAMHAGSHLGKEVADVTLMRGEPEQLIDFLDLSAKTERKVNQNLFCAFIYNAVSIPVAISGLLSPLVAVCAMLLSSLSVILNTLRLVRGYSPPSAQ